MSRLETDARFRRSRRRIDERLQFLPEFAHALLVGGHEAAVALERGDGALAELRPERLVRGLDEVFAVADGEALGLGGVAPPSAIIRCARTRAASM